MLRVLALFAAISVIPRLARAEGLDTFVANLTARPAEAAKHLATCDTLLAPSGEVRRPCTLTAADLTGGDAAVTLKAVRVSRKSFPKSMLEYVEADVEARKGGKLIATYHVLESGGQGNPDGPEGGWVVGAQAWSKLISDKDALALARANKLKAPSIKDGTTPGAKDLRPQEASDRQQGMDTVRQILTGRDDIKEIVASALVNDEGIAIGSAPGQRYTGKAGAKAIRGWKGKFSQQGGVAISGGSMVIYVVTTVTTATIPYVLFAIYVQRLTGGGSMGTSPAMFQFSVAQP